MAEDTLARLFWRRVEGTRARPAQLVKSQGRWHALTWGQVGRVVRELAVGLLALDVKSGEAVAFSLGAVASGYRRTSRYCLRAA